MARPVIRRESAMARRRTVRLFVCGDVMTGRGIDQILPHPSDPGLFEPSMRSALEYVALAERVSGPIPRQVDFDYVWGDAREALSRMRPDARLINLETAVTVSQDADPGRGIHYRMHPANVPCLTAAGIDCCVLANNHVLDWGRRGLEETLRTLRSAGLRFAGAGRGASRAAAPAAIAVPGGRVLVYALAFPSSGVPAHWRARRTRVGVNWFADLSARSVDALSRRIGLDRRSGDLVVASLHWGENWGYDVSAAKREFAHELIDRAGVDLVHGHSSHHPRGIEVHRGKAIFYGCGDLINDYEGIGGYESYRPELRFMYFPALDAGSGELLAMTLVPLRMRRFRLENASAEERAWLRTRMDRECAQWAVRLVPDADGTLALQWPRDSRGPEAAVSGG